MQNLKSISLENFKGISQLTCDFDDISILAGLNNSGKTTILQAVYLLLSALPSIAKYPGVQYGDQKDRQRISLEDALPGLGLRDTAWLSSMLSNEDTGRIIGHFANSLVVTLRVPKAVGFPFIFRIDHDSSVSPPLAELLNAVSRFSVAIVMPPGDVPSREEMIQGAQFENMLRQGKGAQLWRNSIWWALMDKGFESFRPVQERVATYFRDVQLLLPTLSREGQSEIQIKYTEGPHGPFDIAQSGAGLRTFLSLSRILDQSKADVVLLDEPDAHLHASQQAVILDLMLDAAKQRQVILATHSPEIICRAPSEILRWIERDSPTAQGGVDTASMLQRLGVTPDVYLPRERLPSVLVYVEGVKDRPIIDSLIQWCRHRVAELPTTLVVPHRDGRFEGPTLQGIVNVARKMNVDVKVTGVRDLDWYYDDLPQDSPQEKSGDGWTLITLPCKEMENVLCDADLLAHAYDKRVARDEIQRIIDEASGETELIDEWRVQVIHRIRGRLPNSLDPSTKERNADEIFSGWSETPSIRQRLVGGKSLLAKVRQRIRAEHDLQSYPTRMLVGAPSLPRSLNTIVRAIFPDVDFS